MWSQKNVNIRKYCEWLLLGHFEGGIRTPRPFIISFSTLIFSKKIFTQRLVYTTKMKCYLLRTSLCAVAMDKFVSAAWSCSLSGPRLPGKPDLIPKVTLKACCSPGNLSNLALAPVWCCQAVGSLRHSPMTLAEGHTGQQWSACSRLWQTWSWDVKSSQLINLIPRCS